MSDVGLDDRELRFCELVASGCRQDQAYRDAGYEVTSDASASAAACRKMKDVRVVARIRELRDELHDAFALSRVEKRGILGRIARGDLPEGVSVRERLQAISVDNAMTGDNAPVEVDAGGDLMGALMGLLGDQRVKPVEVVCGDVSEEVGNGGGE